MKIRLRQRLEVPIDLDQRGGRLPQAGVRRRGRGSAGRGGGGLGVHAVRHAEPLVEQRGRAGLLCRSGALPGPRRLPGAGDAASRGHLRCTIMNLLGSSFSPGAQGLRACVRACVCGGTNKISPGWAACAIACRSKRAHSCHQPSCILARQSCRVLKIGCSCEWRDHMDRMHWSARDAIGVLPLCMLGSRVACTDRKNKSWSL